MSGLSPVQLAKPYSDLLIALACICTLCIARYLMLNSGISMKGSIIKDYYSMINILILSKDDLIDHLSFSF